MLKYTETAVVFREVPDEVTLAINISNCPFRCPSCHSPHLWGDNGSPLDENALTQLISAENGITCVAFMGGDADIGTLQGLMAYVKTSFPGLKTCWYSGREYEDIPREMFSNLDFLKTGPYRKDLGPLDSPTTNQRFRRINFCDWSQKFEIEDLTSLFHRH